MKIFNRAFVIICISFFNQFCTNSPTKPSIVVVLCDMSQTVANEKNTLFDYLHRLPFCFELYSEFYFFPISENAEQKPLNNDIPIKLLAFTDAEKNKKNDNKLKVQNEIDNVIKELEHFSEQQNKWTCILTSIENAYEKLDSKRKQFGDEYNYKLIIFSDMKESCPSSPIGPNGTYVEMGSELKNFNGNLIELDSAKILMDSYVNSHIDLASSNISLDIITITPGISAPQSKKIVGIWNSVFNKMRYDSLVIMKSSFPFREIQ